jgi:hypothetical protein
MTIYEGGAEKTTLSAIIIKRVEGRNSENLGQFDP